MGNTLSCCASPLADLEEDAIPFPPLVDLAHLDEVISFIEMRLHAIDNSQEASTSSTSNVEAAAASSTVQASSTYGYALIKSVLKRVRKHASQISMRGETRKALIEILRGIPEIHLIVAGLGVVVYVLDRIDTISTNKKECVHFLRYMCGLAKQVKQLESHINQEKLTDVVDFIVNGSFFCISRMQENNLSRFFSASIDAEELKSLQSQLAHTYSDLTLEAVNQIFNRIPRTLPPTQGQDPNAVGIEDGRDQVNKLLNLEDQSQVRGVVLYGVGGIGKTTLATAVFSSLVLQIYRHCRINIQQDCSETDLKKLQEQVLNDLFAEKVELRNCEEGKERLYKLFRKVNPRPIVLFIDNALRGSDLAKLLPNNLSCLPNGSRLLITTRKLNEAQMIKQDWITCCPYRVDYLSEVASKKLLCLKALGNANKDFDKRMDIDILVKICGGVPLVLEMVGSMLRNLGNNVDACESTIEFLQDTTVKGEGDLSEKLVDAVYRTLEDDIYKDAFLDIATFFCNKDKEMVSCIVGAVAFKALEDAALVRISEQGRVIVHDIIQARGRKLSEKDRIKDYQSFQHALKDTQGLEKLKGIWLPDLPYGHSLDFQLGAKHLELMKKSLRVLYIGYGYKLEGESNESFLNHEGSLPACFGHLQSLRFLCIHKCEGLKRLPESFGNLSALKVLTLRVNKLNRLPDSFGKLNRLEELDLCGSEDLESLPSSFSQLSRLKKLNISYCKRLSRLPDGFGQLKSLTHLNMFCCPNLEMVSDDFEQLSSLCVVDAAICDRLDGKAMEKVVEVKSLMILSIISSPLLKERWGQVKAAHPLLVYTGIGGGVSYEDCLWTALFQKDTRFLQNDGDVYYGEWSGDGEGKEVGFVMSTCDLCSPSNKAALDVVKQKIEEMASEAVEIVYVGMGQGEEAIKQSLMELPCGTRAFIAPDHKTNMLFGYSLYQLVDPYLDNKLKYQNTVIARAHTCLNEEGNKSFSRFEMVSADVEEFKDIAGGFRRFFFPLQKMEQWIMR